MTEEIKMRLFKAYSGSVTHASKDGKTTLCGQSIGSIWTEIQPKRYSFMKMCKACSKEYPRVFTQGKQSKLVA